jgi:CSLREA domain-containing protein
MKSSSFASRFLIESSDKHSASRKWLLLAAMALITLASTRLVDAQGILYFVNTTSDTVVVGACQNGNPGCSLRGAIQAANSHPGADGISIDLPAGSVINLTGVLPDIVEGVDIFGPGANLVTVRRNTAANYRIFNITDGPVSISGLTISNGSANTGGGINKSSTTVTVSNCVFRSNGASSGGAISNNGGTANINNCTFTANGANNHGGAIANTFFGTVNVSNSTFSGNIANNPTPNADGGGAICNGDLNLSQAGVLNVTNSTFTGNFGYNGGGILTVAGGSATVTNSTFSGNTAGFSSSGGGISSDSTGPVNIKSTIVALSTGGIDRDVNGSFVSSGFNLIGKVDGGSGFTDATDQTGTIALPLDPKLDPAGLQDNGGPTQTIALQPDSPAIDKGTSNGLTGSLTTDQRGTGFPRAMDYSNITNAAGGDGTDIGACEGTRLKITSITCLANGHILLQGLGMPNRPHKIEASPDLSPNSFVAFPTTPTADGTGALQYDDSTAVGRPKQFYRLRFP